MIEISAFHLQTPWIFLSSLHILQEATLGATILMTILPNLPKVMISGTPIPFCVSDCRLFWNWHSPWSLLSLFFISIHPVTFNCGCRCCADGGVDSDSLKSVEEHCRNTQKVPSQLKSFAIHLYIDKVRRKLCPYTWYCTLWFFLIVRWLGCI